MMRRILLAAATVLPDCLSENMRRLGKGLIHITIVNIELCEKVMGRILVDSGRAFRQSRHAI